MRVKSNFLKRMGALALAAGVVFGALALCGQPASAAAGFEVTDKNYEKTYKQDNGTVYFEAKGTFPVLTDQSAVAKKINQALKKERSQWIKQTKDEAKAANVDVLPSMNASDEIIYEVTENDGKYFSVLMSGYDYQGGAHGMPYRIPLTFDAKTGKKLTAANLLGTTRSKMNAKVRNLYLKKYDKEGINAGFYGEGKSGRAVLKKALAKMDFNNAFYVKKGKAVFYAEPYALGPYASGYIETSAAVR